MKAVIIIVVTTDMKYNKNLSCTICPLANTFTPNFY